MDRLKKIWPYILFLAMFLTIVLLYEYSNRQHMKYKEELEYQQAKSIKKIATEQRQTKPAITRSLPIPELFLITTLVLFS